MSRRLLFLVGAMGAACATERVAADVYMDRVNVTCDGQPFASVHFGAEPRPYVWPLFAPGGVPVTRDFPMGLRDDEAKDHPHHQSLWFTHGDVDGFDFWHGTQHRERIVLTDVSVRTGNRDHVTVICEYNWLVDDDRLVLTETRALTFADRDGVRTIDLVTELRPCGQPLRFGDTKEGTFAMRLHPQLRVDGKAATGTLQNSEGHRGKDAWGKRARWLDDSGMVDGQAVGVTMFDHPSNPRHPTWWHARNYGLLAANPFGVHDFENKPKGTGDLVLQPDESLLLHYRVVLHGAGWDKQRIEQAYRDWVSEGD